MMQALYDRIGAGYSDRRRPDARIAAQIISALGQCHGVLNVGAGAGSYEPADRFVVAVEPSEEMIRQRRCGAAQVVQASAEQLPFRDKSFDVALAILTIHHWPNRGDGLAELRRVARDRVVILTWDPEHSSFWLIRDYFPEILEIDRSIFPNLREIEDVIGPADTYPVPIPAVCSDGFLGAYWRRPEEYLDVQARAAISAFSKFDSAPGLACLRKDIADGSWYKRNAALEAMPALDIGYRLVVARCA